MRTRFLASLSLLVLACGLSACVTSNQQAVANMAAQRMKPEMDAWNQANMLSEQKCGGTEKYNEAGESGDKATVISVRECVDKIYATHVAPFVKYPDLFKATTATARETTRLYKSGDLTFKDVVARSNSNGAKYLQDVQARLEIEFAPQMQQAAYLDQLERQRQSQALQSLGQQISQSNSNAPRQVTCTGTGNFVNCREW